MVRPLHLYVDAIKPTVDVIQWPADMRAEQYKTAAAVLGAILHK